MSLKLEDYRLRDEARILTPALLVYPSLVDANIEATLRIMHGDPDRWRPHLKTSKMPWVIERLIARGVRHFKCATTRELLVACKCGAPDVLIAYPLVGANARRVIEIARIFTGAAISVLVESEAQARAWMGQPVTVFVDVNPGMDRTGMDPSTPARIAELARSLGPQFRGLHYYDGHISEADFGDRERQAHAGYDRLLGILRVLGAHGTRGELITSGTPAFPAAMSYPGFAANALAAAGYTHRASPGTVVFNDATSLESMPPAFGYRAAAVVMTTVVSHPAPHRITCDAGHKSVSADAGVPTCVVIGRPDLEPLKPSEEHLPMAVAPAEQQPPIGSALYLLPRHICPSVNNFDEALLVRSGEVESVQTVAARGHEAAWIAASV